MKVLFKVIFVQYVRYIDVFVYSVFHSLTRPFECSLCTGTYPEVVSLGARVPGLSEYEI